MNIGIIGYGRMGKAIEQLALQRGHNISVIVDENNSEDIAEQLKGKVDVAIEFTTPQSGKNNVFDCIEAGIPIVSGTTGWNVVEADMQKICNEKNSTFFYASNFSIGVNIFMDINEKLASLLSDFDSYNASMVETHHIHKLDKPSGTAISLAKGIFKNNDKYVNWELKPVKDIRNLEIESLREGEIIGDHKIIWDSEIDTIEIAHSAKNRTGFALGAVLAAEFVLGKKGFFTMRDLLKL
ncbi:MAG: 4-hydroxy-tetrahydrodipicolinate reductase [Marinilabiliales bacterium]|nr:MAG: 4-hydroxy-tetrahydrodipicolinate reductase [Marinilabiliales bacterium]